jgi:hypothetical protein
MGSAEVNNSFLASNRQLARFWLNSKASAAIQSFRSLGRKAVRIFEWLRLTNYGMA